MKAYTQRGAGAPLPDAHTLPLGCATGVGSLPHVDQDEAIRIALENTRVVRTLAGLSAASSGRTIYDAAITNTTIDQEQARFDPVLTDRLSVNRTENPFATFDPLDPSRVFITGTRTGKTGC